MAMKSGKSALARIRKICLALPESHEKLAWEAPTFRVRDKIFAMFSNDHHGDGRVALWCKSTHDVQATVVEEDPDRFFVPPYVGGAGWIGIRLDKGLEWDVVTDFVRASYRAIAPKRLRAASEDADASEAGRRAPPRRRARA